MSRYLIEQMLTALKHHTEQTRPIHATELAIKTAEAYLEKIDTTELTGEEILELAEPFGAFQYGDAQGDKRKDFARAILAAQRNK